jgi:hypothetical protein
MPQSTPFPFREVNQSRFRRVLAAAGVLDSALGLSGEYLMNMSAN